METKNNEKPLIWVERITYLAKNSQLSDKMFQEIEEDLSKLSHFFNLEKNQAFLMAVFFKLNTEYMRINLNNLARFFDCNNMDLMRFHNDILQLMYKGVLFGETTNNKKIDINVFNSNLRLNIEIPHCIIDGEAFSNLVTPKIDDNLSLVEFIHNLCQKLLNGKICFQFFIPSVEKIVCNNQSLSLLKKLKKHGIINTKDIIILSYAMIEHIMGSSSFNIKYLSENICENNMEHLLRISEINSLNHILLKTKMVEKESLDNEWEFCVGDNLLIIMHETEIVKPSFKPKFGTNEEFLEEIAQKISMLENKKLPFEFFKSHVIVLVETNKNLEIVKEVLKLKLSDINMSILFYLIHENINKIINVDIIELFTNIYRDKRERVQEIDKINNEEHELLLNHLIEINEGGFFGETTVSLTEVSIDLMKRSNIYKVKSLKKSGITLPEEIVEKPLFFNAEDESSINMLSQLLDEEKYKSVHLRMKEKGLPHGIVALLYGAPGTGKTETVYQLARRHGRPIFKVEISQTKSMWFGESEKRIKKIFKEYQMYCDTQKTMPILLFNEADAIISKRKDSGFSSVSQTENAMQNILLDELERFSGIFIATTNLLQNIDPAFDRRFLFKIEYHQPNGETMTNIWKSKLKDVEAIDIEALSKQFPMSGGQIENIVRKIEMQYILHNKKPTNEEVINWCMEEQQHRVGRIKMGFVVGK